jgi:hypothetical protein
MYDRVVMPEMPRMPRRGQSTRTNATLDRVVHWREEEDGNVYGWCARCGSKVRAVELRHRPDRNLFGKEVQESWECRECNPKPGKYEVLGTSINGK